MFTLEPNKNFDEELRRIGQKDSGENVPHQQRRQQEIIYYYELETTISIELSSPWGIDTGPRTYSNNTFYSSNEDELIKHRQNELRKRSTQITYVSGPITVNRSDGGGSILTFQFSVILSVARPAHFQVSGDDVVTLPGTFRDNTTGIRR